MTDRTGAAAPEKEGIREISVEGLEKTGSGAEAEVYADGDGRIVKLYLPRFGEDHVRKEADLSREAFEAGIPVPETFGLVRSGGRYGIVFQRIRGKTLGQMIASSPENLEAYCRKYLELVKTLHGALPRSGKIPLLKPVLRRRLPLLGAWCSDRELAVFEAMTEALPEGGRMLHGDLHTGNIMDEDGRLFMIDMPNLSLGHPLWDMAAIYRDLIIGSMAPSPELERSLGMPAGLIGRAGRCFFRLYSGLEEGEELDRYLYRMQTVFALNTLFALVSNGKADNPAGEKVASLLTREVILPRQEEYMELCREIRSGTGNGGATEGR